MEKISWRHHYLPVFYLKGFTNENDKFLIFDKEKNSFVKNGKEFSPNSYFFEKEANSFIKDGEKDDFLETKFYSKLDDKVAKLFNLIQSSNTQNKFSVTEEDMPLLQHFVNLMYWRLPHRREKLEAYLQKEDLKGFGLFVKNKEGKSDNQTFIIEERIKNDKEFKKSLGFLMSMVETVKMIQCNTSLTIQPFIEGLPHVCSDNPVIFQNEENPNVHIDDFIFPLSGKLSFIRGEKASEFSLLFKLMVDTLIYKQAVRFVSFTDEKYFHSLNEFYDKFFSNTSELRDKIFEYLKKNDPQHNL